VQDIDRLTERAQGVRAQAATNMNERSSRSHTILTVWLETTRADGKFHSKLNLVDLAGSERRKAVGDKGAETSREGDAINKSLLTLQNVVMALGQKGAVPSFRSSKLTHFLKDSIGGNCKTTLCACAWGDPSKVSETLATCRHAPAASCPLASSYAHAQLTHSTSPQSRHCVHCLVALRAACACASARLA
jgi:Kinesin motor domain